MPAMTVELSGSGDHSELIKDIEKDSINIRIAINTCCYWCTVECISVLVFSRESPNFESVSCAWFKRTIAIASWLAAGFTRIAADCKQFGSGVHERIVLVDNLYAQSYKVSKCTCVKIVFDSLVFVLDMQAKYCSSVHPSSEEVRRGAQARKHLCCHLR